MASSKTDFYILFFTRIVRMFAYGFLSVILAMYLSHIGFSEQSIGVLFTMTLIGDAGITLWITSYADRIGRRRMLVLGAVLMAAAGAVFVMTDSIIFLMIAAIIGVISPSGNEIGPFLSLEQAALSNIIPGGSRTHVFSWYNLAGSFATAAGALCSGWSARILQKTGYAPVESYRTILIVYSILGIVIALSFLYLSSSVEAKAIAQPVRRIFGLHRSRNVVMKLSALFSLDAFAGGFVIQSLMAYWFFRRFGAEEGMLGSIFFGANILAGISALAAGRIAGRIGLVNTMVFTHIPSNIMLCLVPLMPDLTSAVILLLLRFCISQMDVPVRQSYTMAVVDPDERSAASGVTSIARSVGASLSPALSGLMLANPVLIGVPFFVAGGMKIVYDMLLYRNFKSLKPDG